MLQQITITDGHVFWPDEISLGAPQPISECLVSHRQVTDAYLLALCARKAGRLVTFDRAAATLLTEDRMHCIEILEP